MEKFIILIIGILFGWCVHDFIPVDASQFVFNSDLTVTASVPFQPLIVDSGHSTNVSTVTWVSSQEEVDAKFAERESVDPTPTGMERRGLASYSDSACTIWAYEPQGVNDRERMATLGHELLHCFKGNFHE